MVLYHSIHEVLEQNLRKWFKSIHISVARKYIAVAITCGLSNYSLVPRLQIILTTQYLPTLTRKLFWAFTLIAFGEGCKRTYLTTTDVVISAWFVLFEPYECVHLSQRFVSRFARISRTGSECGLTKMTTLTLGRTHSLSVSMMLTQWNIR